MKRTTWLASLGIVSVLSAGVFAQNAGLPREIEFNFKYQVGRNYTQRIVSRNVGEVTLPPPIPAQKMTQTITETLLSHCTKVNPDGSGEFECSIQDVAFKMSLGGINVDFDSRTYDPKANKDFVSGLVGKIFSGMKDIKMVMTLSPSGETIKVEGMKDAIQKVVANLSSGDDAQSKQMKGLFDQMGSLMDDKSMSQELQSLYRFSPGKKGPFKIGDKWDRSWTMKFPVLMGQLQGHGDYELVSIENLRGHPCVKIRSKETFQISNTPESATQPAAGGPLAAMLKNMTMKVSTSGGDGMAYVDYQTGELVQFRSTQTIALDMSISASVQGAGKSKIQPTATESKTTGGSGKTQTVQVNQKFRTSVSADLVEPSDPAASATTTPSP